ncbi:putative structural polyprotein [Bradybaena similaris medionivirus]|nr:putative structural polyprotein [Bradybaena similaris medionivirus]
MYRAFPELNWTAPADVNSIVISSYKTDIRSCAVGCNALSYPSCTLVNPLSAAPFWPKPQFYYPTAGESVYSSAIPPGSYSFTITGTRSRQVLLMAGDNLMVRIGSSFLRCNVYDTYSCDLQGSRKLSFYSSGNLDVYVVSTGYWSMQYVYYGDIYSCSDVYGFRYKTTFIPEFSCSASEARYLLGDPNSGLTICDHRNSTCFAQPSGCTGYDGVNTRRHINATSVKHRGYIGNCYVPPTGFCPLLNIEKGVIFANYSNRWYQLGTGGKGLLLPLNYNYSDIQFYGGAPELGFMFRLNNTQFRPYILEYFDYCNKTFGCSEFSYSDCSRNNILRTKLPRSGTSQFTADYYGHPTDFPSAQAAGIYRLNLTDDYILACDNCFVVRNEIDSSGLYVSESCRRKANRTLNLMNVNKDTIAVYSTTHWTITQLPVKLTDCKENDFVTPFCYTIDDYFCPAHYAAAIALPKARSDVVSCVESSCRAGCEGGYNDSSDASHILLTNYYKPFYGQKGRIRGGQLKPCFNVQKRSLYRRAAEPIHRTDYLRVLHPHQNLSRMRRDVPDQSENYFSVISMHNTSSTCIVNGTTTKCSGYMDYLGDDEVLNHVMYYNDSTYIKMLLLTSGFPNVIVSERAIFNNGSLTTYYVSSTAVDNGYLIGKHILAPFSMLTGTLSSYYNDNNGPLYCCRRIADQTVLFPTNTTLCPTSILRDSKFHHPATVVHVHGIKLNCTDPKVKASFQFFIQYNLTFRTFSCADGDYMHVAGWIVPISSVGIVIFYHQPFHLRSYPPPSFSLQTISRQLSDCVIVRKHAAEVLLSCDKPDIEDGEQVYLNFKHETHEVIAFPPLKKKVIIYDGNYVAHYNNATNGNWCFSVLDYSIDSSNNSDAMYYRQYLSVDPGVLLYYNSDSSYINVTKLGDRIYSYSQLNVTTPMNTKLVTIPARLDKRLVKHCTFLDITSYLYRDSMNYTINASQPHLITVRSTDEYTGNVTDIVAGFGIVIIDVRKVCPNGTCVVYASVGTGNKPLIYRLYWNKCPYWDFMDSVGLPQYNQFAGYLCEHKGVSVALIVTVISIVAIIIATLIFSCIQTSLKAVCCAPCNFMCWCFRGTKHGVQKGAEKLKKLKMYKKVKIVEPAASYKEPDYYSDSLAVKQPYEDSNYRVRAKPWPMVLKMAIIMCLLCNATAMQIQFENLRYENGKLTSDIEMLIVSPLQVGDVFKYNLHPSHDKLLIAPSTLTITVTDVICNYHTNFKYWTSVITSAVKNTFTCCGGISCGEEQCSDTKGVGCKIHTFFDVFQCAWGGKDCFCCDGNDACSVVYEYPAVAWDQPSTYALIVGLTRSGSSVSFQICLDGLCESKTVQILTDVKLSLQNMTMQVTGLTGFVCDYSGDYVAYMGHLYDVNPPAFGNGQPGGIGDTAARTRENFPNTYTPLDFYTSFHKFPRRPGDDFITDSIEEGFIVFKKNVDAGRITPTDNVHRGVTVVETRSNSPLEATIYQKNVPVESATMKVSIPGLVFEVVETVLTFTEITISVVNESCYGCNEGVEIGYKWQVDRPGATYINCKPNFCLFSKLHLPTISGSSSFKIFPTAKIIDFCLELIAQGTTQACVRVISHDQKGYILPERTRIIDGGDQANASRGGFSFDFFSGLGGKLLSGFMTAACIAGIAFLGYKGTQTVMARRNLMSSKMLNGDLPTNLTLAFNFFSEKSTEPTKIAKELNPEFCA